MKTNESQQERSWAINKTCLRVSFALGILAWAESLFASIFSLASGQHSGALWALVAAWPFFYGLVYLLVYGMALADQRALTGSQARTGKSSAWKWLAIVSGENIESPRLYRAGANIALIMFPLFFACFATLTVWAALTRQLN